MFPDIRAQLCRLNASEIATIPVASKSGAGHVKLTMGALSCIVKADGLLRMLQDLPDNAGPEAVIQAIQHSALHAEQWAN
jgi:hypothetical protein